MLISMVKVLDIRVRRELEINEVSKLIYLKERCICNMIKLDIIYMIKYIGKKYLKRIKFMLNKSGLLNYI